MKRFNQFIKEATIKGNPGIPSDDDGDYLGDVERGARQRLGARSDEFPPRPATQEKIGRIMSLTRMSLQKISGKEKELEDLATKIIENEFKNILGNVKLDIKFVRSGRQVKDFMDSEDSSPESMPSYRLLTDPDIIKEVNKRKLINNITQGEAKNTKRLMLLPEVREELTSIFDQSKADELIRIWSEITDIADYLDWVIPVQVKGDMMERSPEGIAGACSISFNVKPKEEQVKSAEEILKDIEEGGDLDDNEEEISDLFDDVEPVVKAVGIDFPMLLHEAVKGIYELIASIAIPKDEKTAEIVILNTSSFEDEAEEFRYGPEIASDLRDFINSRPNSDKYPNIKEEIYRKIYDLEADKFFELVKGMLMKTDKATKDIDKLIKDICDEMEEWYDQESKWEMEDSLSTYSDDGDDDDDDEKDQVDVKDEKEEIDYSSMSKSELTKLVDKALDEGDYDTLNKISPYLESNMEHFESDSWYNPVHSDFDQMSKFQIKCIADQALVENDDELLNQLKPYMESRDWEKYLRSILKNKN